jgi:putative methyltransferase (TIGR04325 family)
MIECWHTPEVAIEMNRNYPVYLNLMDETQHIQVLKEQIKAIPFRHNQQRVLDIGCGTAQISKLFNDYHFEYNGSDLPYIIEQCAQKWHPNYKYIKSQNINDLPIADFDIILMNAFIDVMEHPLQQLEKVLENAKNYVILHRQEFDNTGQTRTTVNDSYNAKTYHSIINQTDFLDLLYKHEFVIIQQFSCSFNNWIDGGKSILLQKHKKWINR